MSPPSQGSDDMSGRFATLTFEREVSAPVAILWQAWTAPAARAVWAAPAPSVMVEFPEADTRVGGREVPLCKVEGQPDNRCEAGWLELRPAARSVSYEVISSEGATRSAALVTADLAGTGTGSRVVVTVQLSLAGRGHGGGLPAGLRRPVWRIPGGRGRADHGAAARDQGTAAGRLGRLDEPGNLARMVGPEGFSCQTKRIDLFVRRRRAPPAGRRGKSLEFGWDTMPTKDSSPRVSSRSNAYIIEGGTQPVVIDATLTNVASQVGWKHAEPLGLPRLSARAGVGARDRPGQHRCRLAAAWREPPRRPLRANLRQRTSLRGRIAAAF